MNVIYGQAQDGIESIEDFTKKIAERLKQYPFLPWRNKATERLIKKLYRKGYNISDTISFIILNN